ncbi:FAD/NAD(P)-binding protein [Rhizobium sp. SG2393]|uniref:FAD/NAD(P)-binding protein n=1 Tax=Rhizobium sp. SG2393 TaxID=3276279 RepID=UPI0036707515
MGTDSESRTIAIIGGGFTGAATALHVLKRSAGQTLPIVIFEPRPSLGPGLAYGTSDPAHRINVPAGKMTLHPDKPESFLDFLAENRVAVDDAHLQGRDGLPYARRADFGRYVAGEIAPYVETGAIRHVRDTVTAIKNDGNGWRVTTSEGTSLSAAAIVIATSHPAPHLPRELQAFAGDTRIIADATQADALVTIRPADPVLIVGNGLTSADVIASLTASGHHGPIHAISRRGLRSRGHNRVAQEPFGTFIDPPSRTALHLLRRIRETIRTAATADIGWQAVIDAVRAEGRRIWQALPVGERRKVVRHLRPYWDVHRFRIAPQVDDVLEAAIANGRLTVEAASIGTVENNGDDLRVTLRRRGTREPHALTVRHIVVTTGPAHGSILQSQPFLANLEAEGLLTLCDTGLGIACDTRSVAISAKGRAVEGLFIAGPLARGTFGELMGLPQVTENAELVAEGLLAHLAVQQDHEPAPLKSVG